MLSATASQRHIKKFIIITNCNRFRVEINEELEVRFKDLQHVLATENHDNLKKLKYFFMLQNQIFFY